MIFKPCTGVCESLSSYKESQLAELLYKTYLNMFQNEGHGRNFSMMNIDDPVRDMNKLSQPQYYRGSLAAFLNQVRSHTSIDWHLVIESFVSLVKNDRRLMIAENYMQELYAYLHLCGYYDASSIARLLDYTEHTVESKEFVQILRGWTSALNVLRVTLVVPRNKLLVFPSLFDLDLGFGTPNVHCSIRGSRGSHLDWAQNIFACVNLAFGRVVPHGDRNTQNFSVSIEQDNSGWSGSSPLTVSFWVPASIILWDPYTARLAFSFLSIPGTIYSYVQKLGMELKVFESLLNDRKHVFITQNAANLQE